MTTSDFIPDDEQHLCAECSRTCDCGMPPQMLPDGYNETCLACTDCVDSLRAKDVEYREANAEALRASSRDF